MRQKPCFNFKPLAQLMFILGLCLLWPGYAGERPQGSEKSCSSAFDLSEGELKKITLARAVLRRYTEIAPALIMALLESPANKEIYRRYTKIAPALIRAGADDLNLADKNGQTLLMHAISRKYKGIALDLIEAGADPNIANKEGQTALMIAAIKGDKEIASALIKAGADPNIANKAGQTALMFAAYQGHEEIARALMEAGGDPNIADIGGTSALMYAEGPRRAKIARMLKTRSSFKP